MSQLPFRPKRVLAIGAHADDIDVPAAGTIAKWAAAGVEIYLLILTRGDRGTDDPHLSPTGLTARRQNEQRTAAKLLGLDPSSVFFANFGDCELENSDALRREIVRYIRELQPDTIMCWDPDFTRSPARRLINHADHQAAGAATLNAVYPLARNTQSYPDIPGVHTVRFVLMVNPDQADWTSDITGYTAVKAKALEAHTSQPGLIAEAAKFGAGGVHAHSLPTVEAFVFMGPLD
jgi:LmbE family N-acetylglucosaminyl deacetylase